MTLAPPVPAPSLFDRILYRIPVIGIFARAIAQDVSAVFYVLPVFLLGLVLAVQTWGLVALTLTALACVPLMFLFFLAVTWP